MIIRDLEPDDLVRCYVITMDNWNKGIAEDAKKEMQAMFSKVYGSPHFFVAVIDGRVVGYAGMRPSWMMSNIYEFVWVNVDPAVQGQGIGAKLTDRRLKEVEWRGGSMVMLMTKSPSFFRKFGFVGIDNNDGWVHMKKNIAPLVLGKRT